ncbi:MAG: hypothetical protein KA314_09195 [Chloroflexi bacterium]|nr:hypothetical protein [Chloroflexota bacterium]MBP8056005.1 hypothetical protein [Chloroflexota bacterium]
MNEMLLDRTGDALIPDGYQVLDSEVAFLTHATEDRPFLVRGASLCQWAADFWNGRNIPFRDLPSPSQALRELVPQLTHDQTQAICDVLPKHLLSELNRLSLTDLLQALYPNALWRTHPSLSHGAEWLLWLYEEQYNSVMEPLLVEQARSWQRDVDDMSYTVYEASNSAAALQVLNIWLGATPNELLNELGVFPKPLSEKLRKHIANIWKDQIIQHQGNLFPALEKLPIPQNLKQSAAQATVTYFERHPQYFTKTLHDQLAPYLTSQEQERILKLMPPPAAADLPTELPSILTWFREQYLPMRQWQSAYGSEADKAVVQDKARQFALWYLENYPRALVGGELHSYLSFNRSASLKQRPDNYVTLLVVPDGLHLLDANALLNEIKNQTDRLTIWTNELAFAPLPTITEICKPALFAGVAPEITDRVQALGTILSDTTDPAESLTAAQPGQLYLWRLSEPDRTYHHYNSSETLRRDVDSRLSAIAAKIADIVNHVPGHLPLRLILTSDHGRLLAKAVRNLNVPTGMKSHGRAAWGQANSNFDEKGYRVTDKLVHLHAGRFGLPEDAVIAFEEDTFRTNDGKTGSEWYPHGGLYPEEVIVPWVELIRDMSLPRLTVQLKGSGQAGQSGTLILLVRNPETIPITAVKLTVAGGGNSHVITINQDVAAYKEEQYRLTLPMWPAKANIRQLAAHLHVQLPNRLPFTVPVKDIQLDSIEMYHRDDILGDLDL